MGFSIDIQKTVKIYYTAGRAVSFPRAEKEAKTIRKETRGIAAPPMQIADARGKKSRVVCIRGPVNSTGRRKARNLAVPPAMGTSSPPTLPVSRVML